MTLSIIILAAALGLAHLVCDSWGVAMGTQIKWLFKPFVWLLFIASFGRVDFRKCKECREREAYLNKIFGKQP